MDTSIINQYAEAIINYAFFIKEELAKDKREREELKQKFQIIIPFNPTQNVSAASQKGEEVKKYKGKTIKQRADGRWWARYTINGKVTAIYGKTQNECYQKLKKALNQVEKGEENLQSATVGQWLEKWLTLYKIGKVKETTIEKIRSLLRAAEPLRNRQINKVTSIDLQTLLNNISAPRKREQVYVCLKDAFTKAYKNRIISLNPFDVVEVSHAKKQRKSKALSHEEEKRLVEACKQNKFGNLYLICLYQGLRLGEALALTAQDIDTEKMQLTVSKSLNGDNKISTPKTETSNRTMPLFKRTVAILPDVKEGRLFAATTRKYYQKCMTTICNSLDLQNVSVHTLRHTFATRCSEAGVPPKVVQKWLGHSTLEMTMNVYTHVNVDFEAKVANKFDTFFDTFDDKK